MVPSRISLTGMIEKYKVMNKENEKRNGVQYGGKDFDELTELLKDPLLRDMIPKKHRKRRNQQVLWCIKEFVKIINHRQTVQQSHLDFPPGELQDLHNEVERLKGVTAALSKTLEATKKKKCKWWPL